MGYTAYWLLTGHLVFELRSTMETLMHHEHTMPIPPSQRMELPVRHALDTLVRACLDKDPDRRPPTADDLSARLLASRERIWSREGVRQWWDRHQSEQPC